MPGQSRFNFTHHVSMASTYENYTGNIWPPVNAYDIVLVDLRPSAPPLQPGFFDGLRDVWAAINAEWVHSKSEPSVKHRHFHNRHRVSQALRALEEYLPSETDRLALKLRADAIESGYSDDALVQLSSINEDVTIVAGQISTWFGKEVAGRPTAFACQRDTNGTELIAQSMQTEAVISEFVRGIDSRLALLPTPEFTPTNLFFMTGEGNLHPKHMAYFLPEDEGVKYSPFKRTYYFRNVHAAMTAHIAAPLHEQFAGSKVDFTSRHRRAIPMLWMRAHDLGHFVGLPDTNFKPLNKASRWNSVVLQEVAADVFGTLVLSGPWAQEFGYSADEAIGFYIAECLRYMNRGLGYFPDSDGMFLQMRYLAQNGFIATYPDGSIRYETREVIDGLRALATELTATLLAGDVSATLSLMKQYGPENPGILEPLLNALKAKSVKSIEYAQEYSSAAQRPATSAA